MLPRGKRPHRFSRFFHAAVSLFDDARAPVNGNLKAGHSAPGMLVHRACNRSAGPRFLPTPEPGVTPYGRVDYLPPVFSVRMARRPRGARRPEAKYRQPCYWRFLGESPRSATHLEKKWTRAQLFSSRDSLRARRERQESVRREAGLPRCDWQSSRLQVETSRQRTHRCS